MCIVCVCVCVCVCVNQPVIDYGTFEQISVLSSLFEDLCNL